MGLHFRGGIAMSWSILCFKGCAQFCHTVHDHTHATVLVRHCCCQQTTPKSSQFSVGRRVISSLIASLKYLNLPDKQTAKARCSRHAAWGTVGMHQSQWDVFSSKIALDMATAVPIARQDRWNRLHSLSHMWTLQDWGASSEQMWWSILILLEALLLCAQKRWHSLPCSMAWLWPPAIHMWACNSLHTLQGNMSGSWCSRTHKSQRWSFGIGSSSYSWKQH